jgi:hypothetical protein
MGSSRRRVAAVVALAAVVAALVAGPAAASPASPRSASVAAAPAAETGPACSPTGGPVVVHGSATPADAKTYRDLPFQVAPGTTRVEVGYSWSDEIPLPDIPVVSGLVQTVFDLGLWDEGGVGTVDGFRGWSGSRQGKTAEGQPPIWVQADTAERGYRPDPVEPGLWHVDLGVAAVAPGGASYTVTVRCLATKVGAPFVSHPVDPTHVADPHPGWYLGDFHMHGYHSNPHGPTGAQMVADAKAKHLDFLPVTEYVTNQHWRELGPVQDANPDVVIWPSREVITYYGHATVFGETPDVVDWRHGAPGVTLREIEDASVRDGALFGIAHPTIFPTALFASFCRGCEFLLGDQIDWDEVTTMEVVSGPPMVDDSEVGGPGLGVQVMNPFILSAMELWQRQLEAGHRITAVSGSDDKLGDGYGSSATAVYARQLSRPALVEAVKAGHAYVKVRGASDSPSVEVTAHAPDGETGIVGDTLHADSGTLDVHVTGGNTQLLIVTKDGVPSGIVPITSDDFHTSIVATRDGTSGPLGTFWRVDTADLKSYTTIGNPVFLAAPSARRAAPSTTTTAPSPAAAGDASPPTTGPHLPATGGGPVPILPLLIVLAAAVAVLGRLGRPHQGGTRG